MTYAEALSLHLSSQVLIHQLNNAGAEEALAGAFEKATSSLFTKGVLGPGFEHTGGSMNLARLCGRTVETSRLPYSSDKDDLTRLSEKEGWRNVNFVCQSGQSDDQTIFVALHQDHLSGADVAAILPQILPEISHLPEMPPEQSTFLSLAKKLRRPPASDDTFFEPAC